MFGVTTSEDNQPVAWVGRYPVHTTTLLVALHVACMVVTCLLFATGAQGVLNFLIFDSAFIWDRGQIWRLITYGFVHHPSGLLWFAVGMYMLFVFGREVEGFIGRKPFITLYALLLLVPAVLLTLFGLVYRTGTAGSSALHFGVFIAFATINPQVEMFLRITAKWVAVILAGIYTMQLLAFNSWSELLVLWTSIGIAFFYVRLRGVGPELLWWSSLKDSLKPKPKFTIVTKPVARRVVEPEDLHESIDPVLDKISRSGIASLTPSERKALDRARARLLKKSE